MATTKCKTCRRSGQKLFLKEEKCFTAKCPMIQKAYAPGRRAKRMKMLSEYGIQLKEKQKLKFTYGLREKQFSNYVKEAMKKSDAETDVLIMSLLESRLDNVVFKLGLAKSRSIARQIVGHGHIYVNGRKVTIPSFRTKKGDKISIKPTSSSKKLFTNLDDNLKKYNTPQWLKLDKAKKEGEVIKNLTRDDIETNINLNSIIGYYSR